MKLSRTEIYLRFDESNKVWFELAFVKSEARFLNFRSNAYSGPCQGPSWSPCAAVTARELSKPCTLEHLNCGFIDFYYLSDDRTSIGNQSIVNI